MESLVSVDESAIKQAVIACLKGKSIKERVDAMIAIAHPDFKAELRKEAKRLYDIWIW